MKRLGLCGLFWFVLISAAQAGGYDDFAKGLSAINRDDNDRAIALFTSALAAGDLAPGLVPAAYYQRGRAHLNKDECAAAVADLSTAAKQKPGYLEAFLLLGTAGLCSGDNTVATDAFSQAIALKPDATTYWARGRARWGVGDFAGAEQDFAYGIKRQPKSVDPYLVLWLEVARIRAGTFDPKMMADDLSTVDTDHWPAPLLQFYSGAKTADEVVRLAGTGEQQDVAGQHCEANFYLAEWWLGQKNRDAARPLLEDARANCPSDFIERFAARTELARLTQPQASSQK